MKMKMKEIPNMKEILKPICLHKEGFGLSSYGDGFYRLKVKEQITKPKDKNLLKKLTIKKGDKVLAIAAYYASWAEQLLKAGAKVDYNDISKSIVNYIKKKAKIKFGRFICSNYESIPKNPREYDWTFTFEACGGRQGLVIAYLRSLLNNKGGILVYFIHPQRFKTGGKPKSYPAIIKTLARIYKTEYSIKEIFIDALRKGESIGKNKHKIFILRTNNLARAKAELDIKVLDFLKNKQKINLKECAKKFGISNKEFKESVNRLSKISRVIKPEFRKTIQIRG